MFSKFFFHDRFISLLKNSFKRYFIVCCNGVIGLWLVYSLNRYGNNYMSLFSIWAPHSSPGWLLYLGAIEWSCSKTTSVGRWTVDLFLYLNSRLWLSQGKMVASHQISKNKKKGSETFREDFFHLLVNMCFSWIFFFLLRIKGCISQDINHSLTNYCTQKEWCTLGYISSSAFTVPSDWIYNRSFNSKLVFILCFVPQPCYQWIIHLEYASYSIFSVSIFFLNCVEFTMSLS